MNKPNAAGQVAEHTAEHGLENTALPVSAAPERRSWQRRSGEPKSNAAGQDATNPAIPISDSLTSPVPAAPNIVGNTEPTYGYYAYHKDYKALRDYTEALQARKDGAIESLKEHMAIAKHAIARAEQAEAATAISDREILRLQNEVLRLEAELGRCATTFEAMPQEATYTAAQVVQCLRALADKENK